MHDRGYKEEGTTTTPFDMVVLNDLYRFNLVADVIDRVPSLGAQAAYAKQAVRNKLIEHNLYIAQHGEDILEIRDWKWGGSKTIWPEVKMPAVIMVINSGLSSVKFGLLQLIPAPAFVMELWTGERGRMVA